MWAIIVLLWLFLDTVILLNLLIELDMQVEAWIYPSITVKTVGFIWLSKLLSLIAKITAMLLLLFILLVFLIEVAFVSFMCKAVKYIKLMRNPPIENRPLQLVDLSLHPNYKKIREKDKINWKKEGF